MPYTYIKERLSEAVFFGPLYVKLSPFKLSDATVRWIDPPGWVERIVFIHWSERALHLVS